MKTAPRQTRRPGDATPAAVEVSIVMPCLNEAETIARCIQKAQRGAEKLGLTAEVIVADNGSTDGSAVIARELGALVVEVARKGYGSALIGGIEAAEGEFVVMGDADDSYDFGDIGPFIDRLRAGDDLVVGNRFAGGIEPGAMPWLHRRLGNPMLSNLTRTFFHTPVRDTHCGLRAFRRDAFQRMQLHATGMEFASEMVIKASLKGMRISEVPVVLHPDGRSRPPHLRSWRDGWRHLKFLLMYSPRWLYLVPGFLLLGVGLILAFALLSGPRELANIVLDLNTLLVACCLAIAGAQLVTFGALSRYFAMKSGFLPSPTSAKQMLRWANTERILQLGGALFFLGLTAFGYAVWSWARLDFGNLFDPFIPRILMLGLTGMVIGIQIAFAAFLFGIFDIGHMSRAQPHE